MLTFKIWLTARFTPDLDASTTLGFKPRSELFLFGGRCRPAFGVFTISPHTTLEKQPGEPLLAV